MKCCWTRRRKGWPRIESFKVHCVRESLDGELTTLQQQKEEMEQQLQRAQQVWNLLLEACRSKSSHDLEVIHHDSSL